MTYGHQIAINTRHPAARTRRRRRAFSARRLKRALHFIGFLAFWATAWALTYTVLLVVMIAMICMS